ncbi:MAG: C39 family peptidase [Phycisphaeraceae bacterium]|nr:C39 family peptidase [Phycisphaeraceae bacterium]
MKTELKLEIKAQPDDVSCGPTCLHALYNYYGYHAMSLQKVMREIQRLDHGGTLIEILACHALKRGFHATIYTFHLQMFDPTWFAEDGVAHNASDLSERLAQQLKVKAADHRLRMATKACREFVSLGGELKMVDLDSSLISNYVHKGIPILTGLSSTYLYRHPREYGPHNEEDDVRGEPQGHFVMIIGYDGPKREVLVADPLDNNPPFHTAKYRLPTSRLINAILLGSLTHDANLLVIRPADKKK